MVQPNKSQTRHTTAALPPNLLIEKELNNRGLTGNGPVDPTVYTRKPDPAPTILTPTGLNPAQTTNPTSLDSPDRTNSTSLVLLPALPGFYPVKPLSLCAEWGK